MNVTLKLFATLRQYLPPGNDGKAALLKLADNTSVAEVIGSLKLPAEQKVIVFINAAHAEDSQTLYDGDILSVFPPIAGG